RSLFGRIAVSLLRAIPRNERRAPGSNQRRQPYRRRPGSARGRVAAAAACVLVALGALVELVQLDLLGEGGLAELAGEGTGGSADVAADGDDHAVEEIDELGVGGGAARVRALSAGAREGGDAPGDFRLEPGGDGLVAGRDGLAD